MNTSWLQQNLRPALQLIGTVIATIGGIILLSAVTKLVFVTPTTDPYIQESCEAMKDPSSNRNVIDVDECVANRTALNKEREQEQRTSLAIDGASLVIVGGVLALSQRKRSTKKKN